MNASYGPGYWQLVTRTDLPAELAQVERRRRAARKSGMAVIAETAWQAAGNHGETPGEVLAEVASHLSPHFTAAVVTEAGRDWRCAANLACGAITRSIESSMKPLP